MILEIIIPSIFFACIYFNRDENSGEEIEEGRRYKGDKQINNI
jgi:hypothetical protein